MTMGPEKVFAKRAPKPKYSSLLKESTAKECSRSYEDIGMHIRIIDLEK
jgi:hypothetical protein